MTTLSNARFNAEAAAWDANPDVHRASAAALDAILASFPALFGEPAAAASSSRSTPGRTIDVLEIGCGTGLLSLRLAPYVSSLVAVDAAEGMIDALRLKLESGAGVPGDYDGDQNTKSEDEMQRENEMLRKTVHPLCMLLEDPEDPRLPPATSDGDNTTQTEGGGSATAGQTQPQPPRKKFDLIISHLTLHHIPGSVLPSLLRTMHGCLKPGTGWVALTDYQDLATDESHDSLYLSPSTITTTQTQTTPNKQKDTTKFHPHAKLPGVEHPRGIHAASLAALMRHDSIGFVDVDVRPAWKMRKDVERWPGEWGQEGNQKPAGDEKQGVESMEFPFLLCRGRRMGD